MFFYLDAQGDQWLFNNKKSYVFTKTSRFQVEEEHTESFLPRKIKIFWKFTYLSFNCTIRMFYLYLGVIGIREIL